MEEVTKSKIIGLIFLFCGVIVALIIFYICSQQKSYQNSKLDSKMDFVYAKKNTDFGENIHIPYINVKGDTAKKFNQEIFELENAYAYLSQNEIGFTYNKSKNILSLAIQIKDYHTLYGQPETIFKTFLLRLDTLEEYTKEEIYHDYGITEETISKSLEKGFHRLYEGSKEAGYVDPYECDYECFLKWRGVDDYLDGAALYIENRGLVVFRGFIVDSVFGEENYFKNRDFKFEVQS